MNKINILLTEANGNLASSKEMIETAVKKAAAYMFPKLKVNWDIDLLVTNRLYGIIIPEDGVGGVTRASDFIEFSIDEERANENLISEMLVHEICHAARWGKNGEWVDSLFDSIISEGIATHIEAEFVKNRKEKTVFIKTILERASDENRRLLEKLYNQLDSNRYDYDAIFFNGNNELPRWSGYSLGYYLVEKYLKKTDRKIGDVFADQYSDFKIVL